MRPRAIGYVRVSTETQRYGYSPETQEEAVKKYCEEQGYQLTKTHHEVYTGVAWERPKLDLVLGDARAGKTDVIVAYCVDRLSRDPVHLMALIYEAEQMGVRVEFIQDPSGNTPEDQLMLFVKAWAARKEHSAIVERISRAMKARVEKGMLYPHPKPRYGYRFADEKKSRLEIYEPEAEIVRRMFGLYVEGWTLRKIAQTFTSEGIPSPKGKRQWSRESVRDMLRDPAYTGKAYARHYHEVRDAKNKRKVIYDLSTAVELPAGTVPAIIDEPKFHVVQERLTMNKTASSRRCKHPEQYLLRAGHIRCGHCGGSMGASHRGPKNGIDLLVYICRGSLSERKGCPNPSISAKKIDNIVWGIIVERVLKRRTIIAQEIERQYKERGVRTTIDALDKLIADVERQQGTIIENLITVKLDPNTAAMIQARAHELAEQKEALTKKRAAVIIEEREWEEMRSSFERWCEEAEQRVGSMTYEEKRLVLRALKVQVQVWRVGEGPNGSRAMVTVAPLKRHYNIVTGTGSGTGHKAEESLDVLSLSWPIVA